MKKYLAITAMIIFTAVTFRFSLAFAQAPPIEWQKALGGDSTDLCLSARQTPDGGYIAVGSVVSNDGDVSLNHGNSDFWVAKMNVSGGTEWSRAYGGSDNDSAYAVEITSDGGYAVVGSSFSSDGDATSNQGSGDYWIIKIDISGNLMWQKSYGGSGYDQANSVEQTTDGGYIVSGYTKSGDGDVVGKHSNYDYWVIKLGESGALEWSKCLGGDGPDKGYSAKKTLDGGYIVVGGSNSTDGDVSLNHGGFDYWVVKLHADGTIEWEKSFGGSHADLGCSVAVTADGYVVTGQSASSDGDVSGAHGRFDFWTFKIDDVGTLVWQKTSGGSNDDIAYSVAQAGDGFVVAGFSNSNDGDVTGNHGANDVWVTLLDGFGNFEWGTSLGGSKSDGGTFVEQTSDGGYVVAACTKSEDGDITGLYGGYDFWVVKLAGLATDISVPHSVNYFDLYPNPFIDYISSSQEIDVYTISDGLGRIVATGHDQQILDTKNLSPGLYVMKVTFAGTTLVQRMIKY